MIRTARLDLHAVQPAEYSILAVDRDHPSLWSGRGFSNPHRHLVDDPGPLVHRIPRILADPAAAPYLLRMAVLRQAGVIVGSAGFHDLPDESGMIEIGLEIVPEWQGRGLGRELLLGMWGWVVQQPGVRMLRYTVSPTNAVSLALVRSFGFEYRGQQIDDEDGPEDIFEMTAEAFSRRWLTEAQGTEAVRLPEYSQALPGSRRL